MANKWVYILLPIALMLQHFPEIGTSSPFHDPHFVGNRSTITHLMEWKYEDIAAECERFLGPYGYGGVQISPANEHAVLAGRPWYERYQPVSYKIETRSGTEEQFRNMVDRCNKAGVRIYVDLVLNHMTQGQSGVGTAGSTYNGATMNYPGVPFGQDNFHGHESCPNQDLNIHNYSNLIEARNCRMSDLRDINQSIEYVRNKQADYLNRLIDIGVAGFRSDASQHQWPADLHAIYEKLHNLNTKYFAANQKPFIYHEIVYYGDDRISSKEYLSMGRTIEFRYYRDLCEVFRGNSKRLSLLKNFGQQWGLVSGNDALVMIDSHDLQRGHTGKLGLNIAYFEHRLLKASTAFMLAWNYGIPRIMSSYFWNQVIRDGNDINDGVGPPADGQGQILSVRPNPDLTCNKEWICEHRWRQIYSMVQFRNIAGNEPVQHWWDNGNNQIAFGRGSKAFFIINMQLGERLNQNLQTGLPTGTYCDVSTSNFKDRHCSGRTVFVDGTGRATFVIEADQEDPFIAIHIGEKL